MQRLVVMICIAGWAVFGWADQPVDSSVLVDLVGFPCGFEPGARVFASEGVLELRFDVELNPPINGFHLLELILTNPNGHHYQTFAAPITGEPGMEGRLTKIPGYPNLVPAQLVSASKGPDGQPGSATLRLPVAGTPILSNSLYGVWRYAARLDGEEIDCEGLTTFTMLSPTVGMIFGDGFVSGTSDRWSHP